MAKEKCYICGKDIERGFMNKIIGSTIKKNNKILYICNICQKEEAKKTKYNE